jgi:Tol biopolymer transport system component
MGEVYRAKDPRLGRDVAIKVLPASFSQDPDRLKRFEQEARAAGVLNHPGITAVFDFGSHDGSPYIVTELLEGETLRSRLGAGAIGARKAIDYAVQMAKGLAAAHEKGIVHRDLKPENVFLTNDGRVKILDFGLAKLKGEDAPSGQTDLKTVSGGTQPGVVLGTMGYMAPEQVRGKAADKRSDLFAFGTILYEMLSGQRAFKGDTAADTITAILSKEPPDLSQTNKEIPPGLDRIVRHCLEKNPEERFESARDVAFDLEALSNVSSTSGVTAVPVPRKRAGWLAPALIAAAIALAAGLAAGFRLGKAAGGGEPPAFQQLTFRRGEVYSARFAPDGQTIFYAAAWDGRPVELFATRSDRTESRAFGLVGADLLGISRSGEMAVSLDRHNVFAFVRSGTLAEVGVSGGVAPRSIAEDIQWADWGPDGRELAIIRDANQKSLLEFPVGKKLYETTGWLSHPRVSRDGSKVAFLEHPTRGDDGGTVSVVDRNGKKSVLGSRFASEWGLAWSPDGSEVWATGAKIGANRALHAMALAGGERLLARVTQSLTLQDVTADGKALVSHDSIRIGIHVGGAGFAKERELAWLDWSSLFDVSRDGKTILFSETGEGSGPTYSTFIRTVDGAPPVRLGDGGAQSLSFDGRWVLVTLIGEKTSVMLYPTGAGEKVRLDTGNVEPQGGGSFLPDGKRVAFTGAEPGRGARIYVLELPNGKPRAISPEGYRCFSSSVSPDGKVLLAAGPDGRRYAYPIAGGEPAPIPGLGPSDFARWSADPRFLFTHSRRELPARVHRMDISTGKKEFLFEVMPPDASGIVDVSPIIPTPDGKNYVYGFQRTLSDLYILDGLK